jgi:hypothetical protein
MKISIRKSYRLVWLVAAVYWTSVWMSGSAARADTIEDLKMQINALQQKVEALEKQQVETKKVVASVEQTAPKTASQKGYFVIPGTNTEMKIGGYVKLDAIYSSKSAGDESAADQYFDPPSIPLNDAPNLERDQTVLHARQSRFNFATITDTSFGKFKTFLEADFFGSGGNQNVSNSYGLRLRHAYGEFGNLLAGQTWSTFEIMDSLPETLDFGGPAAQTFDRQAQIRWTEPFEWGSLQFAVENPNTTFLNASGVKAEAEDDHVPDMVARVNLKTGFGSYSVAVMGRQLSWDDGVNSDDAWGGAVSLGGRIPTFDKDDLRFQINYGNALGRYMTTGFADVVVDTSIQNPDVNTFDQWGGFIGYRHFWISNLRSNLIYSYGEADNDLNIVPTTVNKKFQSVHANLIWSPIPSIDLGVEYLYGYREVESGEKGDLNRVQVSAQYNFF